MKRVTPRIDTLPHALYRAAQVRALDRAAIEGAGIPGAELMTRAGAAAFAFARERWPAARDITVVAGPGNNGGDGYVVAELARAAGLASRVLQVGDHAKAAPDARAMRERYRANGGEIVPLGRLPKRTDLLLDALLGTGLERELAGAFADAVAQLNAHPAPVLAIDIPSGLHADSGTVLGCAVEAAATISFIGLKQGLFTGAARDHTGEIRFDALQVPARVYASQIAAARRVDWAQQAGQLAPRRRTAHKGEFGHVLVIGGAAGFGGAARLAAEAALRGGAGLVSLATHPDHAAAVTAARPELMVHAVGEGGLLDALLERATVVAVGPGLGAGPWGQRLWHQLTESRRPMVVDADALNLLTHAPRASDDWILTPHPGEAARLLDSDTAQVQRDRFAAVAALQSRYGGVAVLKGAGTLIQAHGRPPAVCSDGNPGMASGGMGDLLTGLIAALLAQGDGLEAAAIGGVCLHAAAADRAAARGERGLIASDLLGELRGLLQC